MGTFLKYLFYVALIVVIYLVGKGVYNGNINEKTTVGQVVNDVESGSKNIIQEGVDSTKDAVDNAKNAANNYQEAPKKDIVVAE